MNDLCKYVNIFHGSGEIDLPKPEGIAAKWFFIKAGCGNTSPAATVPFGAISVAPYSGGYPTGYGNHLPNSHSHPAKFEEGKKLLGFAHIQQSGTGAIEYYYNYALTTPRYEASEKRRTPEDENAVPGYYSCRLEDIKCELTAADRTALHRYVFGKEGGQTVIDFTNNGLTYPGLEKAKVHELRTTRVSDNTFTASAKIEGIYLYFAVKGTGKLLLTENGATFVCREKEENIKLSYSVSSEEKALAYLEAAADFDSVKSEAYARWNAELNKLRIETEDERIKRIFYSNLYHSFVKPADLSGESFLYGDGKPFLSDFATLWDMYKTALPLIFMVNRDIAEKAVETLLSTGEAMGHIPNSIGLCDKFMMHDSQARMLADYALLTAYRYGIPMDAHRMVKVIRNDVFADNKHDFTVDHRCRTYTWVLDMADGCALAAKAAEEIGELSIASELKPLADLWKTAYDEKTGLLKPDSDYYEGTLYNYSFRQMVDMDERIRIAGGKERFVQLLDDFFGYGKEDTVQPTDPFNYAPVAEGIKLGRFEGFNNESDTESPFSYIYAGRHDRTCEVIRAGMKYMFTEGRGGIPGNNDTGALSSYYVFMALGLFPVAGQDLFLIASPFVDKAEISLFNGKTLTVKVNGSAERNIYVSSVSFNGEELKDYRIAAGRLMQGGLLEFTMTDKYTNGG